MASGKVHSKENWIATRELFTWHLRPPFKNEFDNSHWWKNEANIEPISAVYELVRRHPFIGIIRQNIQNFPRQTGFDRIEFLLLYGLKPWPELGKSPELGQTSEVTRNVQEVFHLVAGKIKGIDLRADSEQLYSIKEEAWGQISGGRASKQRKYRKMLLKKVSALVKRDMVKHPPKPKEIEAKIKTIAIEAYRNGYHLFACAPDLVVDKAQLLLAKEFRRISHGDGKRNQRARFEQWLDIIEQFEDAENTKHKAKSQLFARYHRVIAAIDFI